MRHFLVLISEFWSLLINFIWLWIDLIEGTVKIKPKSFCFWGISTKPFFFLLFLVLIFLFPLFFLLICDITCLFSLDFPHFIIPCMLGCWFKFLLCYMFLFFGLGFLKACLCVHAFYMHTHTIGLCTQAYVCASMLVLKNHNLSFFTSVSLFLSHNMPLFWPSFMFLSLCFSTWLLVCL